MSKMDLQLEMSEISSESSLCIDRPHVGFCLQVNSADEAVFVLQMRLFVGLSEDLLLNDSSPNKVILQQVHLFKDYTEILERSRMELMLSPDCSPSEII